MTPSNLTRADAVGGRARSAPGASPHLTLYQTVREPMASTLLDIAAADFLSDADLLELMILLDWIVSLPEAAATA